MILKREKIDTSRGRVYRIDIVDTSDSLGYLSKKPPIVRVMEDVTCPKCLQENHWVYVLETRQGRCICGNVWVC